MLDTADVTAEVRELAAGDQHTMKPVSLVMFRLKPPEDKKTAL
jgi:hypothetical protein